ncbi:unnamed protein product, partial [Urochloa humidicola]
PVLPTNPTALLPLETNTSLQVGKPVDPVAGPNSQRPRLRQSKPPRMAAETTAPPPPSLPPPATAAAPRHPRLSGFEQLDARAKELTSSQAELLERIQKLKQEVQNWRSNVETQVKTCQNEIQDLKKGLYSEVEQLKSEMKEIRSAIQEEKDNLPTPMTTSETSNDGTEQGMQTQDQPLKVDTDASMEEQTETQA